MTFYDEVLRELLAAVGAAMFFGNLYALARRRADAQRAAAARPGAARASRAPKRGAARPVRSSSSSSAGRRQGGDLPQAPVLRTFLYVALGFVMMVAGLAALIAG